MRWSEYFLYTAREAPPEAESSSHRWLLRAGLIRKLGAGLYTYLPAGWRSLRKLEVLVRREVGAAGCAELALPGLQPAELWQESGRWSALGPELLRLADRQGRQLGLATGPEEALAELVRHQVKSYRQLPVSLFQVAATFRDEPRPRGGLLRAREHQTLAGCSFHATAQSLDVHCQELGSALRRVFAACELEVIAGSGGTPANMNVLYGRHAEPAQAR